jgi:LPS sulfotransferase NodH
MDVYRKILVEVYQRTGGRAGRTVDLKELVKAMGFYGNFEDIFQRLSNEGWIVETQKANYVEITHWGVQEAKNAMSDATNAAVSQELKTKAKRLISNTEELLAILKQFATDPSKRNLAGIEEKSGEINSAIDNLKKSIQ